MEALTLTNLGWSLMEDGHYASARDVSARSISIYRELGDDRSAVWPTMALAWALLHAGDAQACRAMLCETLEFLRDHVNPRRDEAIPTCMEGVAAAAASQGEHARAVRLMAAVDHLRDVLGRPLPASERGLADPWLEPLREVNTEPTLAAWRSEGEALSLDQALAYALAVEE